MNKNEICERILAIIATYDEAITIRQLYYQLYAKRVIENKTSEYTKIKRYTVELRKNGSIPMDDIEDRTRTVERNVYAYISPESDIQYRLDDLFDVAERFKIPINTYQPSITVIVLEKQALEGIFSKVCSDHSVPLVVCRGYNSLSQLYQLKQELDRIHEIMDQCKISGMQESPEIQDETPHFSNISHQDYILLNGVGKEQLINYFFDDWFNYFLKSFRISEKKNIILFVPCAAIKPYYNSPIHKYINKKISKFQNVQKIVISNAGVIPYEYCDRFPFNAYDWNPLFETKEIMDLYIDITTERLVKFISNCLLQTTQDFSIISYLREESESLKSLKNACLKLKLLVKSVKVDGILEETKDSDLKLILPQNLERLENMIKINGGFV